MRKIINSAFVSLDGVTADPGSWAIFDPDAAEEAVQALHALGGMLMGRGTYEYFADVIPKQTGPYAWVPQMILAFGTRNSGLSWENRSAHGEAACN
jgi:dihydrofolate reductase